MPNYTVSVAKQEEKQQKPSQMIIGDFARILSDADRSEKFEGKILIKTYSCFSLLDDLSKTWSGSANLLDSRFTLKILRNTEITIKIS